MPHTRVKHLLAVVFVVAAAAILFLLVSARQRGVVTKPLETFAAGRGRIEAGEQAVAAGRAGRVGKILIAEGEMVEAGQAAALMDTEPLKAAVAQAEARLAQARDDRQKAWAALAQRESEIDQALTAIGQRETELSAAAGNLERLQALFDKDLIARQEVDEARAAKQTLEARLAVERSRKQTAEAALLAAQVQLHRQDLAIQTAGSDIQRLRAEIADDTLKSPIRGRVSTQHIKAGAVVTPGSRVLSVMNLGRISMTVSLPVDLENRIAAGSEARIVLDAAPAQPIPAAVSLVAVESRAASEKDDTPPELLRVTLTVDPQSLKYAKALKPGLQGTAHVRLDPEADWPEHLRLRE